VRATLLAAAENMTCLESRGRLFVMFQPHRYTRTADLMDEFAGSLRGPDRVVLLDIYHAGERPIEGVTSEVLYAKMKEKGDENTVYFNDKNEAMKYLISEMRSGDILLTLGAGDVWKAGEKFLEILNAD
jgi:UDP-N-acetylmuramate--alanine ligase